MLHNDEDLFERVVLDASAKDDVSPFMSDTAALNLWSVDIFKQITEQLS